MNLKLCQGCGKHIPEDHERNIIRYLADVTSSATMKRIGAGYCWVCHHSRKSAEKEAAD